MKTKKLFHYCNSDSRSKKKIERKRFLKKKKEKKKKETLFRAKQFVETTELSPGVPLVCVKHVLFKPNRPQSAKPQKQGSAPTEEPSVF